MVAWRLGDDVLLDWCCVAFDPWPVTSVPAQDHVGGERFVDSIKHAGVAK